MMFKTHLAFGFLVGLLLLPYFSHGKQLLFMTVVLMASALPDIDHPNSKVGKNIKIIGFLFEHRGFWHSLWAIGLLGLLIDFFLGHFVVTAAFIIGYGSHMVIDCATKAGIMPLHPLTKWRIKGFLVTNGVLEYALLVLIIIIDIIQLVKL